MANGSHHISKGQIMNHLPFKLTKKSYFKVSLQTWLHLKNMLSAVPSHSEGFQIHPFEILQMPPQTAYTGHRHEHCFALGKSVWHSY